MNERLASEKLAEIQKRHQAATPGRYVWRVDPLSKNVKLMSLTSMMPIVMAFWRWGMRCAAPVFRDAKHDLLRRVDHWIPDGERLGSRIDHPDAEALAFSWQDREDLLNHIAATETQHQEFVDAVKLLVKALQEENETLKDRLEGFRPLLNQHGIYFPLTRIPVDRKEGEPVCEATR